QGVRYEWFIRDYLSKKARNGLGSATLSDRQDTRHRLRYELGTTWMETFLRVRQEWYLHDSNDARNDFYDAGDYKVSAFVHRPLTKRLSLNVSYSFERKNYKHRPVVGIRPEARYDDTHTWTVAGAYEFNRAWSLNPSVSRRSLNSNEPTGEYVDTTISANLTARF
ncbi:MAG: outer membrane beta-barrel protein, partial [Candidatus Omnitrophica bacterium]|nr:outer membrane beta-barrel protein [Candidatus Omnitrophota bacterium]